MSKVKVYTKTQIINLAKMLADTGLTTNLAIRELRLDEEYWFYVANPGYWPVTVELVLENAAEVFDAVKGDRVAKSGWGGKTKVELDLNPFDVAAFKIPAADAKIVEWKGEAVRGKQTGHLERIVAETEALFANPGALVVLRPEDEILMVVATGIEEQPRATFTIEMTVLEGGPVMAVRDLMDTEVAVLSDVQMGVMLAADGHQGLDVLRDYLDEVSIVVLDLSMPGMSGGVLLDEFLQLGAKAPVLVTSGYDEDTVAEVIELERVAGFLQKPYTADVLARAVRTVLDRVR